LVTDESDDAGRHFHVGHEEGCRLRAQGKQIFRALIAGFLQKISELNVPLPDFEAVTAERIIETGKASPRVGEVLRSCDGGNFAMTKPDQVLGGEFGAQPVVDDNCIDILQPRLTIKID
jgi:hypothetical protein